MKNLSFVSCDAFVASVLAIANSCPDGFTVNASTFEPVASGYSVAIEETQNSFGPDGLAAVYDAIMAGLADCVGGWYDSESGLYYFDAVNIYSEEFAAIEAGRRNGQIAIFNLDTCKEIRL